MKIALRPCLGSSVLGLLLLLIPGLARPAAAGVNRFTPFGPMNGTFKSLVVDPSDPSTLLAAVGLNGVFRSGDGGLTWIWSGVGLGAALPQALAADPQTAGFFYAIGTTQVFRSADHGGSWSVVGSGQDFNAPFVFNANNDLVFPQLIALPADLGPPTLLAGAGPALQRSVDGGATWSRVYTAEKPETGWTLRSDPTDPNRVWAALLSSQGGGLLASSDRGQTWRRLASVPDPFGLGVAALVALPAPPGQPETLLVSAGCSCSEEAVFKSTDDGATWRQVQLATPHQLAVTALAYEPQTPSIVYAAAAENLFVSMDTGETWLKRGAGLRVITIDALLTAAGTRNVYALSAHNVQASADRGRHWAPLAHSGYEPFGPSGAAGFDLRSSPQDPATLYIVFDERAWRSRDSGATWASVADNILPLSFPFVHDLVVDPANPNILYVTTGSGIFSTADGGTTWSLFSAAQFTHLQLVGRKLALATDCGVSRSTDGGRNWKRTLSCSATLPGDFEGRSVDRLFLAPHEPAVVYAEVTEVIGRHPPMPHHQIWKSTDGGTHWSEIVAEGFALALDPERAGRLYLYRNGAIQRSDNGGRTFRALSAFFAVDLLVDPVTPSTLYAATGPGGIYRSTDGGFSWFSINADLTRFVNRPWDADRLVLNPSRPHLLVAGVNGWILQNQLTEP